MLPAYICLHMAGGYSHAPYELTYGVDMKKIRWCGILQVTGFRLFFLIFSVDQEYMLKQQHRNIR